MSKNQRARPRNKARVGSTQGSAGLDARIRRTHERLGMALLALIEDTPLQEVTVQQVLDRAGVGRSTFYLHFRDKNDLLLSQLEVFLEIMSTKLSESQELSQRVAPVTEMFEHIGQQRIIYRSLADSGKLHDFFDLAQDYFARGIEQRLRDSKRAAKFPPQELKARAVALAGSLLALFRWWMDRGGKEPASELDALFHRLVWEGMR